MSRCNRKFKYVKSNAAAAATAVIVIPTMLGGISTRALCLVGVTPPDLNLSSQPPTTTQRAQPTVTRRNHLPGWHTPRILCCKFQGFSEDFRRLPRAELSTVSDFALLSNWNLLETAVV